MADHVLQEAQRIHTSRLVRGGPKAWRSRSSISGSWRLGDFRLAPLGLFLVLAVLGPLVLPTDPAAQNLSNRLSAPLWMDGSWSHPLGTDSLGRDLLARVAGGARESLIVGLLAASLSAVIGVTLAFVAAQFRGAVDAVITMLVEIVLAVPLIVVGIVVTAILGASLRNLVVLLVFVGWINYARVVRLEARRIAVSGYVDASRAIGASRARITIHHVLPNTLPVVTVLLCQQIAAVMIWEASLTFLGLGLPIEQVTLGGMIRDGQVNLFDGWWVSVIPGVGIALAVVAFHGLADWTRDELDPTTSRRWRQSSTRGQSTIPDRMTITTNDARTGHFQG